MALIVTNVVAKSTVDQAKPRASIEVQSAVAGVVIQVPVSQISFIDLTYSTSVQVFAASSSYTSPLVDVELDRTGRYKIIFLAVQMLDGTRFQIFKGARDTFSLTDALDKSFTKKLIDQAQTQEELAFSLSKYLVDTFGLADDAAKVFAKKLVDSLTTADAKSTHLYKLLKDGFALNDSLDAGDGLVYQVLKNVANVVFAAEVHRVDLSKLLQDLVGLVDVPKLTVSKRFTDQFTQSDDASLQTSKALFDAQVVIDSTVRSVSKSLNDLAVALETHSLSINKPLTDLFGLADSLQLSVSKATADAVSVASDLQISAQKALADSLLATDYSYLLVGKVVADSLLVDDEFNKVVNKGFSDSAVLTDLLTRTLVFIRNLSDAFAVNDSTGVGDGLAMQSIKTIANVAFMNDVFLKQYALRKTETITGSDTGSLVSQGYCDLSYFAEDYVGAIRSF
jgi:hypothetical protein